MALSTPTLLTSSVSETGATSLTSASFSAPANALIIVAIILNRSGGYPGVTTASSTFTSGTWTRNVRSQYNSYQEVAIFTSQTGATPGSGTVTVNWTSTASRNVMFVYYVTGHNTTTPVAQTVSGGDSLTDTPSISFGSSPASTSTVFGVQGSAGATAIAPDTNFTELNEAVTPSSTGKIRAEVEYDAGSAGTAVGWTLTGSFNSCEAAIEIAAASVSEVSATLSATLSAPTLTTATATVDVVGTLSATLSSPTLTAALTVDVVATLTSTLSLPSLSSQSKVEVVATLSATISPPSLTMTGTVDVVGTLTSTLSGPTLTGTAKVDVVGVLNSVLSSPSLVSAGTVEVQAVASNLISSPSLVSTSVVEVLAVVSATLTSPTLVSTLFSGDIFIVYFPISVDLEIEREFQIE